MSAVLLLLVLVSGFIYTSLHVPARFKQKRVTGWDSYFYVVVWGACWGFFSALVCVLVDYFDCVANTLVLLDLNLKDLSKLAIQFDDLRLIAWAFTSVFLSLSFGLLSKLYYWIFEDRKLKHIAKIARNDHLDTFILEASATQQPILVTLSSRKCYVGICFGEAGFDDGGSDHLSILPLLSGYRDKDTLSLEIKTNYHVHFEDNNIYSGKHDSLTVNHFRVIIPKSEIETYSFFDVDTFKAFKDMEKRCIDQGADSIGIPNVSYDGESAEQSYKDFNATPNR
ncbi:hypothetical protein [Vibrio parahaemolyticus]|uniref:hypothetical protein n=1 Tax=Vibrio parahaemolyticus TaxID=670 RepID=UPI00235EE4CF|nr:hypothetical protein [Vibrio parahaemolyticus]